ncbi:MAG: radical SAM protein [Deltaproteobacteria bacterium]|nr:MAG: radical SAM protein [Deltaproteobacteria bacterium]
MWFLGETLDYEGQIVRPPSEANSIILQATVGCSHNRCTFCVTYLAKRFRLKEQETVENDIKKAAKLYPEVTRLFVADGDALIMPMERWEWLLGLIKEHLPAVKRVSAYATGKSVRKKSDEELARLKELGLGILYLGVESGDDPTLEYIKKDSTAAELVEAGQRIKKAGIKVSITILLGIAPPGREMEHAVNTGKLITAMDPDYVGCLSVMVCEGTELEELVRSGKHHIPDAAGYMRELKGILENTRMSRGLFMSNHASNHLPLKVRMPGGREAAIEMIERGLRGEARLRPEGYRAL